MFPLNLHKNILQLDRQISLLENECKQMDLDNRKNNGLLKQSHSNKCSKTLNAHVKPPSSKVLTKKACESGKTKKLSPVVPSRVDSTSSVPSYCGKQHNRVCDSMVLNQATNPKGVNSKFYQCSCCDTKNNRFYTLQQKHTKCNCGNKDLSENCLNSLQFGEKSDCILHKEVLLSKPGSSIEVTVKQKPSCAVQKENFSFTNLSDKATKEVESCGCLIKKNKKALGQKWSEILSVEPNKQNRESNCISDNSKPCSSSLDRKSNKESLSDNNCNEMNCAKEDDLHRNVKSEYPSQNQQVFRIELSKDNNSVLKNIQSENIPVHVLKNNSLPIFEFLINELKEKLSEEEKKKIINNVKLAENEVISQDTQKPVKEIKNDACNGLNSQNDFIQTIQKLCDNLIKEKEYLSQELISKNSTITTLRKREEEYLSLISTLKLNLEKTKDNAKSNISSVKEFDTLKEKLFEQRKMSETLKKTHMQLKEALVKCALENDRLKTEIRIYKLESQKHDILIAGKEAEIKKYREEIGNFQKQISDHLASLKSNAQVIDMKKMMEAIIQQSQIFCHDDLDSVVMEENLKNLSKPNGLMHSSPTTTKTSDVNSSWKRISSIKNHEPLLNLSKSNEKEFYQVYGDISDFESSENSFKKHKEKLVAAEENLDSSFTSCLSINNEENALSGLKTKSTCEDKEVCEVGKKMESTSSSQKLKSSIDELLKNMKLKWSEEIYGTSPENDTIDDFLNGSRLSSISD